MHRFVDFSQWGSCGVVRQHFSSRAHEPAPQRTPGPPGCEPASGSTPGGATKQSPRKGGSRTGARTCTPGSGSGRPRGRARTTVRLRREAPRTTESTRSGRKSRGRRARSTPRPRRNPRGRRTGARRRSCSRSPANTGTEPDRRRRRFRPSTAECTRDHPNDRKRRIAPRGCSSREARLRSGRVVRDR